MEEPGIKDIVKKLSLNDTFHINTADGAFV